MLIIVGQQKAKSLVHVKALTDVRRWFAAKFSNNFDLQKDPFKFVSLVPPPSSLPKSVHHTHWFPVTSSRIDCLPMFL